LDVATEIGTLEGARVDGPDIHVFSQPEEGATVEPGASLRVVWERDEKADSATMEIDSTLHRYLVDSGESTIDRESLAAANPNSLQHTLRVARSIGVSLGGSAEWSATVVNAIDPITPPRRGPSVGPRRARNPPGVTYPGGEAVRLPRMSPPTDAAKSEELPGAVSQTWRRFLEVYEPLRPALYRFCRYLSRSPWDAEDLVQDTLA